MDYEDFEIQIGPRTESGYLLHVLQSPAGHGEGLLVLPEELLGLSFSAGSWPGTQRHVAAAPKATAASLARAGPSLPREVGGRLFDALFQGQIGSLFHQSLSRVDGEGANGLRIRLRINPGDQALAPIQRLPWELLYRQETEDFLALSRSTPVVRSPAVPRPTADRYSKHPLQILIAVSEDAGTQPLDLEKELTELGSALERKAGLEVRVLRNPDLRQLRRALSDMGAHVLHYMGHGAFDPSTGDGILPLSGAGSASGWVSGRTLATKIKDLKSLHLAVLNACETALSSGTAGQNPFAGVATALVLGGLPAVVAMQAPIADRPAIAFSSALYEGLAAGLPIDEAVTEGRQAIHDLDPDGIEWAIPVLFLRSPTGNLLSRPFQAAPGPQPRPRHRPRHLWLAAGTLGLAGLTAAVGVAKLWPPAESSFAEPEETGRQAELPVTSNREALAHEVTVGQEPTTVHFEIRFEAAADATVTAAFSEALREAAQPLAEPGAEYDRLSGRVAVIEVGPPRLDSRKDSSFEWRSCRLSAMCRLKGPGGVLSVGTIQATRAAVAEIDACQAAAAELAKAAVLKFSRHLQEESK